MKGIILAGGEGTRLHPLTKVTSKQLLPVYDKPMIYYPLNTLLRAGIKDILIIVAPGRSGDFLNLLGSGKEFGARFTYEIQDKPEGLAQALLIGEHFIAGDHCALILGDNIYTDDFTESVKHFKAGAKIFAKKVPDAQRFGVVEIGKDGQVISLEEKPAVPKSSYAQTGFYLYDGRASRLARTLERSARGELEIVDLHNLYLTQGQLEVEIVQGEWIDAGTFESLYKASKIARDYQLGMNNKEMGSLSVTINQSLELKREVKMGS